jgi:hypothetical protein
MPITLSTLFCTDKVDSLFKENNCIGDFPDDIDRSHFGSWLSGFTDGEGHFALSILTDKRYPKLRTPDAHFKIKLRSDDKSVLFLIQSYLRCGVISHNKKRGGSEPQIIFCVSRFKHLVDIVIPHFDSFPLLAKKRTDFKIWKEAVNLIHSVSMRPCKLVSDPLCAFAGGKRRVTKWNDNDLNRFYGFKSTLSEQRRYREEKSCQ